MKGQGKGANKEVISGQVPPSETSYALSCKASVKCTLGLSIVSSEARELCGVV